MNSSPQYTGRLVCAACHAQQDAQWTGSHHDLAMQPATAKTVLGNFDNASLTHFGVTTSFVTCSDCHEPHSVTLRLPRNGVCLQCHQADKYDQSSHHFHLPGSQGASCAECHMPPRTYMVVDPRHDHSMRVPLPDLSVKLEIPNACNNCSQDKDAAWAAAQVNTW